MTRVLRKTRVVGRVPLKGGWFGRILFYFYFFWGGGEVFGFVGEEWETEFGRVLRGLCGANTYVLALKSPYLWMMVLTTSSTSCSAG